MDQQLMAKKLQLQKKAGERIKLLYSKYPTLCSLSLQISNVIGPLNFSSLLSTLVLLKCTRINYSL